MTHRSTQHEQATAGDARSLSPWARGFTLIELLVVIAVIGILAGLVLSATNRALKSSKRIAAQRSAEALVQAIEQFESQFGFLPPLVHDGVSVSAGDPNYRPELPGGTIAEDGPILEVTGGPTTFYTVTIWSEGLDFHFFRRRTGTAGSDDIDLSTGTGWDDDAAWDDRRYSKYSLAYYLAGVLDRDIDGVRGAGFARPNIDGSYLGVGYPVGSSRDRYDPMIDVDRRGVRVAIDYIDPNEYPEHLLDGSDPKDRDAAYNDYEPYQRRALVSLVDSFGNAYRYYRWESGRFENGRLVVENELDLNIPPVLIDPVLTARVMNDPANLDVANIDDADFTQGDLKLRNGRFAVVSAGPDGLFGTESIETIADYFRIDVPTDLEEIAELRRDVWKDNAVGIGN